MSEKERPGGEAGPVTIRGWRFVYRSALHFCPHASPHEVTQ